jgi:hypothetical protein
MMAPAIFPSIGTVLSKPVSGIKDATAPLVPASPLRVGAIDQCLGGEKSQGPSRDGRLPVVFGGNPQLARSLNSVWRGREFAMRSRKGRMNMSGQSQLSRTLIAMVAAVVTSAVAVGAAVGPAQALANPVVVSTNA